MESQNKENNEGMQPQASHGGKLFLYLFGIPLIVTIILVGVANALGW
ncbi:MAG: hypothetical protein MUC50_20215 [Myxococcota bacterium]|nr:hypothetical protein [Myxococcota bacterium]